MAERSGGERWGARSEARRGLLGTAGRPVGFLLALGLAALAVGSAAREAAGARKEDPPVSGGAAPGYVPDRVCAQCHSKLWRSYQEVGMARSFAPMNPEGRDEDFEAEPFHHAPSGNTYAMVRREDGFYQERWRTDAQGERYAHYEQRVEWAMGSGNNGRAYFYKTPSGELFQLPLIWYPKLGGWGMGPGYDLARHDGFSRMINRDCMFCHNAYPDVPAGSDAHLEPSIFPSELPHGIGCQRCHGPGAEHVALANDLDEPLERVLESIVNPARLSPERRDDVCFQCHLQTTAAFAPSVRRFGRGDYDFRPGDALEDHHVPVDFDDGRDPGERFEINHHAYRLRQSPCFVGSGGALSCLDCHDPHRKVQPEERAEHYRRTCLDCHAMAALEAPHAEVAELEEALADSDCTRCHMPRRRTEDVIQVTMTDHRIRRQPAPAEWMAPKEEQGLIPYRGMRLYFQDRGPEGEERELYSRVAALRMGDRTALERVVALLEGVQPASADPWLDLGAAWSDLGRWTDARRAFEEARRLEPELGLAALQLASAYTALGLEELARREFRAARELDAENPEVAFRWAEAWVHFGKPERALAELDRGLQARPNHAPGHHRRGTLMADLKRHEEAAISFEEAVAIDPMHAASWSGLGRALRRLERPAEALRAWSRGLEIEPTDPELLRQLSRGLLTAEDASLRDDARALHLAERARLFAPLEALDATTLAWARALGGKLPEARAMLEEARELGADDEDCRLVEAWILALGGEPKRSRALLEVARNARGRSPLRAALVERLEERIDR